MAHGYSAENPAPLQDSEADRSSSVDTQVTTTDSTNSNIDVLIESSYIVSNRMADASSVAPFTPTAVLKENAIRDALQRQLEYYFSLENLKQDPYLVSQMNSDQFVLISTVASFKLVRSLTEDVGLITSVLQASEMVELNDTLDKVRPVHSLKRTTIIIRDTPEGTKEDDVLEIFKRDSTCPLPTGVRADIGNTWFVTFDNEESTRGALFSIRDMKIREAPIKARIKSENLLRSTGFAPNSMEVPILGMDGQFHMGMMPMHMPQMGVGKDSKYAEVYTDNAEMYSADMYYQQPMYYPGWMPQYYPGNGMVPQYQQPYAHMNNGDPRRHSQHSSNGYPRGGRRHSNREWHQNQKKYQHTKEGSEHAHQHAYTQDTDNDGETRGGAEDEAGDMQHEYGDHGNAYANGGYGSAKQRKTHPQYDGYAHSGTPHGAAGNGDIGVGENGVNGGGANGANGDAGGNPRHSHSHGGTHREGGRRHHKNHKNGGYHSNGSHGGDGNHHRNHNYKNHTHRNGNQHHNSHQHNNNKANAAASKPASFDTNSFPPLSGDGKCADNSEPIKSTQPSSTTSTANKLADIVKASIDSQSKAPVASANATPAQRKQTQKKGANATTANRTSPKDEHTGKHTKKDASASSDQTSTDTGTASDAITKQTTSATAANKNPASLSDANPKAAVSTSATTPAPVLKILDTSSPIKPDTPGTQEDLSGGAKKTSWAQMMKSASAVPMATTGAPLSVNETHTAPASPTKPVTPKKHSASSPKPKRNHYRQNGDRRKDHHSNYKKDKTPQAIRRDE